MGATPVTEYGHFRKGFSETIELLPNPARTVKEDFLELVLDIWAEIFQVKKAFQTKSVQRLRGKRRVMLLLETFKWLRVARVWDSSQGMTERKLDN